MQYLIVTPTPVKEERSEGYYCQGSSPSSPTFFPSKTLPELPYGRLRSSTPTAFLHSKPTINHQPATAYQSLTTPTQLAPTTHYGIAPPLARPPRPLAPLPPHPRRRLSNLPDHNPPARDAVGRATHARAETRRRVQRRVRFFFVPLTSLLLHVGVGPWNFMLWGTLCRGASPLA